MMVDRDVVPHFEDWEAAGMVDRKLYLKAGDLGIMGLGAPEEFGGSGVDDFRYNAVVVEEFCRRGVLNAVLGIYNHVDVCMPYFIGLATGEQRHRWLPRTGLR